MFESCRVHLISKRLSRDSLFPLSLARRFTVNNGLLIGIAKSCRRASINFFRNTVSTKREFLRQALTLMKYLIFIFIIFISLNSRQSFQGLTAENEDRSSNLSRQDTFHTDSQSDLTDECSISCPCSNFESAATDHVLILSCVNKSPAADDAAVGHSAPDDYSPKYLDSIWQPPKTIV